jgi:hypothetical protein
MMLCLEVAVVCLVWDSRGSFFESAATFNIKLL